MSKILSSVGSFSRSLQLLSLGSQCPHSHTPMKGKENAHRGMKQGVTNDGEEGFVNSGERPKNEEKNAHVPDH